MQETIVIVLYEVYSSEFIDRTSANRKGVFQPGFPLVYFYDLQLVSF